MNDDYDNVVLISENETSGQEVRKNKYSSRRKRLEENKNLVDEFAELRNDFFLGNRDEVISDIIDLQKNDGEYGKSNSINGGCEITEKNDFTKIKKFLEENRKINEHFIAAHSNPNLVDNPHQCMDSEFPFLPAEVDLKHIHSNGKLLTKTEIDNVHAQFNKQKRDYYSKHDLEIGYSILNFDGQLFALYKEIGRGQEKSVRLMQNIDTGKWFTVDCYRSDKKVLVDMEDEDKIIEKRQFKIGPVIAKENAEHDFKILAQLNQNVSEKIINHSKKPPLSYYGDDGYFTDEYGNPDNVANYDLDNNTIKFKVAAPYYHGMDMKTYFFDKFKNAPDSVFLHYGLAFLKAYKTQIKDNKIIHRDIKLQNAIVDPGTGNINIIDRGFAILSNEADLYKEEYRGSYYHTAPEIFRDAPNKSVVYGEMTDMWAIACSLANFFGLDTKYKKELQDGVKIKLIKIRKEEECDDETVIDGEHRKKMIAFLNFLMEKRPTIEEAIEQYEEKFIKPIPQIEKTRRIAIFDVNEYLNAGYFGKARIRENLKGANEVWMVSTHRDDAIIQNTKHLMEIQRELENANIFVGRRLFTSSSDNVKDAVYGILEKTAKEEGNIRGFYFVTTDEKISLDESRIHVIQANSKDPEQINRDYAKSRVEIKSFQLQSVIDGLDKEINRLKFRYANKRYDNNIPNETIRTRIKHIENYKTELKILNSNDKSLTFAELEIDLNILQKQMVSTGIGFTKSTGEKNIENIKTHVMTQFRL